MSKAFIGIVAIVLILGAIWYFFFYSGEAPITTTTPEVTTPTETAEVTAITTIDESGASSTATDAETVASESAGEIGAVDALEVPRVNE